MNKKKNLSKEELANHGMEIQMKKAKLAELEDLEIKARYWKAQFEIRDYTLKAEAIQPSYDEYLAKEKERNEELQKQWKEHIEKLKEQGITPEGLLDKVEGKMVDVEVTQHILDMNPDMVEQGLKLGDTIKVSEAPEEEGTLTLEDETTGEVSFK